MKNPNQELFELIFEQTFINRVNFIYQQQFTNILECLTFYMSIDKCKQSKVHTQNGVNVLDQLLSKKSYKFQPFSHKHLVEVTIPKYLQESWTKEEKKEIHELITKTVRQIFNTKMEFNQLRAQVIRIVTEELNLKNKNKNFQAIYCFMYQTINKWHEQQIQATNSAIQMLKMDVFDLEQLFYNQ